MKMITYGIKRAAFLLALSASPLIASEAPRPNIILIMVDDMGFSDLGCYGGEINTPNIDDLAAGGIKFSQFTNSARCCPTRASLLTGMHPHQTGIGHMTNSPTKQRDPNPPSYQGYLNRNCATIGELLRPAGYTTLMSGKWHLGQHEENRWPRQRGFDRYYGCIAGATRFFEPLAPRHMSLDNTPIETPKSTTYEAFYTTDAFTDHAINFIEASKKDNKDKPFFLYLAYTAPHWPLQAFEDDIAKYRGKYKIGWDKLREQRYQKQISLGLIKPEWKLSPRPKSIPVWDTLNAKKQDEMDLKMAVYAAMIDRVDQNIGKLVSSLKSQKIYDNTLILFLSDNGACAEGGIFGRGDFYDIKKRNLSENNAYGEAWANAGSTPFRLYKSNAHQGGSATPFIAHWPAAIKPQKDWNETPAQIIDVVPTLLELAGASYPAELGSHKLLPIEGDSITPVFDRQPIKRTSPFFIEHQKNAFVRDGDWKLVGKNLVMGTEVKAEKWELYHLAKDRTELNDLSKVNPEKRKQLAAAWNEWATRTGVFKGASTKEMKEKKTKKQKTGVDINLWENEVPGFPADFEHKPYTQQDPERITDTSRPSMRIFPAQGKPTGKALIILPGGSYRILADKKEGDRVAEFYASKGITCFVVRYRVTKHDHKGYRFPGPLLDARQSIRMVKSMAKKYGYSADQVGVMGFSAGGHLASMCATRFDDTFEGEDSNGDVRPAFVALIYPVASMIAPSSHGGSKKAIFGNNPNKEDLIAASPERRVKKGYPPLFIAHNEFDPVDAKLSIALKDAYNRVGVPCELHLFSGKAHGFGMGKAGETIKENPAIIWPKLLLDYMNR